MKESNQVKQEETSEEVVSSISLPEEKIENNHVDSKNGQIKCPKCGSTDISLNSNNGKLRCHFCRHEFEEEKFGHDTNINNLKGYVVGSGASDIQTDSKDIITLKCTSCGSEVVIDTASKVQARCHWCRNTLSLNEQIPNGAVPDFVLPFKIKKEDAKIVIESFVKKRQFYAHPKFKAEFQTDNILGVYLPYMIVDVNAHASMIGQGEHLVRSYSSGTGDNKRTYYDADLFYIEREFDIAIDDLTIESSSDKLNKKSSDKTTNIINSIMPFDIENAVRWDANYLRGFSSEKRDTNVSSLKDLALTQAKDVARFACNETLLHYDRGVAWKTEQLDIIGQRWNAAYLPIWLYSYQQDKGGEKVLHYVAVNARTKEIMGSVPVNVPKLLLVSLLVEVIAILAMLFIDFDYSFIFLAAGFIFYFFNYSRYRNDSARHLHELETKKTMSNLRKEDKLIKRETGLSNSSMRGANNFKIRG